jgi:hypothetical protein
MMTQEGCRNKQSASDQKFTHRIEEIQETPQSRQVFPDRALNWLTLIANQTLCHSANPFGLGRQNNPVVCMGGNNDYMKMEFLCKTC